jgi:hypothetical protein
MTCEKCGSPTQVREGNKNGKHWKGAFCINKECGNVRWVKTQNGGVAAKSVESTLVMDEIAALNKRLDSMATYLKEMKEEITDLIYKSSPK